MLRKCITLIAGVVGFLMVAHVLAASGNVAERTRHAPETKTYRDLNGQLDERRVKLESLDGDRRWYDGDPEIDDREKDGHDWEHTAVRHEYRSDNAMLKFQIVWFTGRSVFALWWMPHMPPHPPIRNGSMNVYPHANQKRESHGDEQGKDRFVGPPFRR